MTKTLNELIGKRIVKIRPITEAERKEEGWDNYLSATSVLELEDGTLIYPSSDDEGNAAGTLFGKDKEGKAFYVWSKEEVKRPEPTRLMRKPKGWHRESARHSLARKGIKTGRKKEKHIIFETAGGKIKIPQSKIKPIVETHLKESKKLGFLND